MSTAPAPRERKIGLGYTAEGYRVVAELALYPADPERTQQSITHAEIAKPARFSAMFTLTDPRGRGRGDIVAAGQIPADERVIVRRHERDASPETAALINTLWERWHLNDVRAACAHMTPEMLDPDDAAERAFLAEHGTRGYDRADDVASYRLKTVVCPETGYSYGHAWLAEEIDADALAEIEHLIEHGRSLAEGVAL